MNAITVAKAGGRAFSRPAGTIGPAENTRWRRVIADAGDLLQVALTPENNQE